MGLNHNFWQGKRVFLTGHTGFKGAWMSELLSHLGATVTGYSLQPLTSPNMFDEAKIVDLLTNDYRADITHLSELTTALHTVEPEIVIHMAAQSLVIEGYQNPVTTYSSNVMGTVNVLDAIRSVDSVKSALMITTDKCYENKESDSGYREQDRLGGYDPYSNSKACAEFVVRSFRDSYFSKRNSPQIASLRAGNVIGGGDWSENRLIPDCIRAFQKNQAVTLRSPKSIRPWQHVLDPLCGYLLLAEKLYSTHNQFNEAWNFGPNKEGEVDTFTIADQMAGLWGSGATVVCADQDNDVVETKVLRLDSSKAKEHLHWQQKWDVSTTLEKTVQWYKAVWNGKSAHAVTIQQIQQYLS